MSPLFNAPCLAFPDYKIRCIMYVNALGLGVVLVKPNTLGKIVLLRTRVGLWTQIDLTIQWLKRHKLVVWVLINFRDIILGYPITVYTDHATVTELTGRPARWYLAIHELAPFFTFLLERSNAQLEHYIHNCLSLERGSWTKWGAKPAKNIYWITS